MTTQTKKKKKAEDTKEEVQRVYRWRYVWVDLITLYMLGSYHWDFWSKGDNAIPAEIAWVYWAALCAYWIIKEQVRHSYDALKPRSGGWYVVIWGLVLGEFAFMMQLKPGIFQMPEYLVHTCIIVLLGYVGILSARRFFASLFPALASALSDESEQPDEEDDRWQ